MMNPHLPAVPPGSFPGPPYSGRRRHEQYAQPQNPHMHPSHYNNYHAHQPPHGMYPPQQYPQWNQYTHAYSYPQHQPRYHQAPLIVSSHPHPHPPAPVQQLPPPVRPASSTHSQTILSPNTSATSISIPSPPPKQSSPLPSTSLPPRPSSPIPPKLPWLSVPDEPFPPRAPRRRRKRRAVSLSTSPLQILPLNSPRGPGSESSALDTQSSDHQGASDSDTPQTSRPPSEIDSSNPAAPSSTAIPSSNPTPTETVRHRPTSSVKTILPALPAIPNLPRHSQKPSTDTAVNKEHTNVQPENPAPELDAGLPNVVDKELSATPSPAKEAPRSWADLLRSNAAKAAFVAPSSSANGTPTSHDQNNVKGPSLGEALTSLSESGIIAQNARVAFLEPRGLVNTGNMCYMNSVLQILLFCVPFYDFLDRVGKQAVHHFNSETPLLDAMIMFMKEFPVIDSAESVEKLRMRLKEGELEQYGEPFTPDFVYEVIRRLPRFSSMRRGHQQDAEEFLGFLLEGLHDECAHAMLSTDTSRAHSGVSTPTADSTNIQTNGSNDNLGRDEGWLEVGPKQKPSVTRSSGSISTESPITKIFGGKLRSELRIPGLKNSVTLEPYQPLQLDIQSPQIRNITDALKGLTRSERLHGDFNSPRGKDATATKQVFIDTLPPVLILHLKRFEYNNAGGTQKIWKKIGYPLDLEIPKEVFPPSKRAGIINQGGLPKYRLIGVVYHHGKNASGGHYTVDVRRQEGREWIRLDDTLIRRIRSQDVAEVGSEEDSKVLATALEHHSRESTSRFGELEEEQVAKRENGWKQVNGGIGPQGSSSSTGGSGSSTPTSKARQQDRFSVKDNKVAYLLFYQKIKV